MRPRHLVAIGLLLAGAGCGESTQQRPSGSAGAVNTLKWTAAHEERVFGYLVYRADTRDGPFLRVNASIVRVPGDDAETHAYAWADRDVEAGKTYFYYLDVVSDSGIKRRFSGIMSRTTPP